MSDPTAPGTEASNVRVSGIEPTRDEITMATRRFQERNSDAVRHLGELMQENARHGGMPMANMLNGQAAEAFGGTDNPLASLCLQAWHSVEGLVQTDRDLPDYLRNGVRQRLYDEMTGLDKVLGRDAPLQVRRTVDEPPPEDMPGGFTLR